MAPTHWTNTQVQPSEAVAAQGSSDSSLEEFLLPLRGSQVFYCPNPGNGGDSLIALATFQLFEKLEIRTRFVEWDEDVDLADQVVIYAGGGNLVGLYPQARSFFKRHHRRAKRLILLPSTVWKNEDLLESMESNVDLICRERISYEHVLRTARRANVHLMDDAAFNLDVGAVMAARVPSIWWMAIRSAARELFGRAAPGDVTARTAARCLKARSRSAAGWRLPKGNVLNAFRTDREKPDRPLPEDNIDLSRVFALGTHSRTAAEYASHRFLSVIDRFDRVRTDRLHVCIGGALLGKEVEFYPNSYFKNEAVFEFSLRDRFPNVSWQNG